MTKNEVCLLLILANYFECLELSALIAVDSSTFSPRHFGNKNEISLYIKSVTDDSNVILNKMGINLNSSRVVELNRNFSYHEAVDSLVHFCRWAFENSDNFQDFDLALLFTNEDLCRLGTSRNYEDACNTKGLGKQNIKCISC